MTCSSPGSNSAVMSRTTGLPPARQQSPSILSIEPSLLLPPSRADKKKKKYRRPGNSRQDADRKFRWRHDHPRQHIGQVEQDGAQQGRGNDQEAIVGTLQQAQDMRDDKPDKTDDPDDGSGNSHHQGIDQQDPAF